MSRAWSLVLVAVSACTPAQAPVARKVGQYLAIGGTAALTISATLEGYTDAAQDFMFGSAAASAIGILLYAYVELAQPEVTYLKEPLPVRNRRWAKILSERASGAARENRCGRVRRLERRIFQYDRDTHDFILMADPEVVRCLTLSPPTSLAPGEDPAAAPLVPVMPEVAPEVAVPPDAAE
jgi:hypothetical protein